MSTVGVTREILSDQIDWWHTDKHGFTKYQPSSNNVPLTETELDSSVWGSLQGLVEQLSLEAWHNNARQTFQRVAVNDCAISQRDISKITYLLCQWRSLTGLWKLNADLCRRSIGIYTRNRQRCSNFNVQWETRDEERKSLSLFLSCKREREIISHVSNWRKRKGWPIGPRWQMD